MPWTYRQSTGELTGPSGSLIGTGYSGHGDGLNNPLLQSVENVGPIPEGWWTIGPAYTHPRLGVLTMNLDPDPSTETFGRDDFRIHGDNATMNQTASDGCIVQDHGPRSMVAGSPDRRLLVAA